MNIMVVDDDDLSREALTKFLADLGHQVTACANGEQALTFYQGGDFPMVVTDIKMPGITGMALLQTLKTMPECWRTDVVLCTGYGDMQSAINALRAGAYDYLLKPVDAEQLAAVTERVAEHQLLLRENKRLTQNFAAEVAAATVETRSELQELKKEIAKATVEDGIGVFSPVMQKLVQAAAEYHQARDMPVLIEGETGVGKELIARVVHQGFDKSADTVGTFVAINCAALNDSLFESELFGYEAGSFTGGLARGQKGKLDAAAGGTLFLDEIGDLPLALQAKLLRVLQEKEFYRVGGLKKIKTDIRLLCASNVNLLQRVQAGTFRQDLYYRLKVGHLLVPPLRERVEDIGLLAELFLQRFASQRRKRFTSIAPAALVILERYAWPGNVRELRNAMEWVVFVYDDSQLQPWHLETLCRETGLENKQEQTEKGEIDVAAAMATCSQALVLPPLAAGYTLKAYTDLIINQMLEFCGHNQTVSARSLGISRSTLCERLEKMKRK